MTGPVARTAPGPPPAGAVQQVGALLRLRWQMLRSPGARVLLCVAALVLLELLVLCLRSGGRLDPALLEVAVALAPQALLAFGALALIAPLTAGATQLLPPDQLVAFPARPSATFLGGLLLAPFNLVWVLQLLLLAGITASLTVGGDLLPGAVTTAAYAAFATVLGQTLSWGVAGLRHTRRGARLAAAAGAGLALVVVLLAPYGLAAAALGLTALVERAVVAGGAGETAVWLPVTAALSVATVLTGRLGVRTCAWALARPEAPDAGSRDRARARRRSRRSALAELVAVDRASVWRAPALRRGALVLGVLPAVLVVGADVPWASLVVVPGLVAAGAGLLFGTNVFCLDAAGALWLASLPSDPGLRARAKLRVLTEVVLGAAVLTAAAGALRTYRPPTAAELSAVVVSALTCTAVVVAVGFGRSVRTPHRADLRGPRDAAAPPGALLVGSVRLALPTTLTGLLLGGGAASGLWWLPPVLAVPVLALTALSLSRSLRRWQDPAMRARVVQRVSTG